ncbi:hypothetical protein XENTR_v10007685 [Xenopus tropicalis]|nr:hypothetical protein XENTR_v10007685 [Xenopus tropicalis]
MVRTPRDPLCLHRAACVLRAAFFPDPVGPNVRVSEVSAELSRRNSPPSSLPSAPSLSRDVNRSQSQLLSSLD